MFTEPSKLSSLNAKVSFIYECQTDENNQALDQNIYMPKSNIALPRIEIDSIMESLVKELQTNVDCLDLLEFDPPLLKNVFHIQRIMAYKKLMEYMGSSISKGNIDSQNNIFSMLNSEALSPGINVSVSNDLYSLANTAMRKFIEEIDEKKFELFAKNLPSVYSKILKWDDYLPTGLNVGDLKEILSTKEFMAFNNLILDLQIQIEKSLDLFNRAKLYSLLDPKYLSEVLSSNNNKVFNNIIFKKLKEVWNSGKSLTTIKKVEFTLIKWIWHFITKIIPVTIKQGLNSHTLSIMTLASILYVMIGESLLPISMSSRLIIPNFATFVTGLAMSKCLNVVQNKVSNIENRDEIMKQSQNIQDGIKDLEKFNTRLENMIKECFWDNVMNRSTTFEEFNKKKILLNSELKLLFDPNKVKDTLIEANEMQELDDILKVLIIEEEKDEYNIINAKCFTEDNGFLVIE